MPLFPAHPLLIQHKAGILSARSRRQDCRRLELIQRQRALVGTAEIIRACVIAGGGGISDAATDAGYRLHEPQKAVEGY